MSDDVRTAITLIEHDRLSYRGHDATVLAADRTFVEVVELLWQRPARLVAGPQDVDRARRLLHQLPPEASAADRLALVARACAAGTVDRHDLAPDQVTTAMGRLLATSAVTTGAVTPGDVATTDGSTPPPEPVDVPATLAGALGISQVRWVEQALVLLADHDMAGSTTAARVAASARADPYAVVAAAAGAFDSPLHGTAGRRAHRLLGALAEDPAATLAECLQDRPVPGFGHLVYAEQDPRAEFLLDRLAELVDHPLLASVELLSDRLWQRRGLVRTVDLALALGAHLLGGGSRLPEVLFLHARLVGWTAHALEEYREPPLRFRLQGVYTGPRP
nr:citrate/2-methylcitrate synthase [Auraticoccus cholistanensis]